MTKKKNNRTNNDRKNTTEKKLNIEQQRKPEVHSGVFCALHNVHEFSIHYSLL